MRQRDRQRIQLPGSGPGARRRHRSRPRRDLRARPPSPREVRVTVAQDAIPRRSATLADDAFVAGRPGTGPRRTGRSTRGRRAGDGRRPPNVERPFGMNGPRRRLAGRRWPARSRSARTSVRLRARADHGAGSSPHRHPAGADQGTRGRMVGIPISGGDDPVLRRSERGGGRQRTCRHAAHRRPRLTGRPRRPRQRRRDARRRRIGGRPRRGRDRGRSARRARCRGAARATGRSRVGRRRPPGPVCRGATPRRRALRAGHPRPGPGRHRRSTPCAGPADLRRARGRGRQASWRADPRAVHDAKDAAQGGFRAAVRAPRQTGSSSRPRRATG